MGTLLLLEFGDCKQGNECLPFFLWVSVCTLLSTLISQKWRNTFILSYSHLSNSWKTWEQNVSQMWILYKWSLGMELSRLVIPCWQLSLVPMAVVVTLPSQEPNSPAEMLDHSYLMSSPPSSSLCWLPGSSGRAKGLLEEDDASHRHVKGWFWGLLGRLTLFTRVSNVLPTLEHLPTFVTWSFYQRDNCKWGRLLKSSMA